MLDEGEFWGGLFVLWLSLVSLVGYYVVRIALMLRKQVVMERIVRLRLAALRGKAVREAARSSETQGAEAYRATAPVRSSSHFTRSR